MELYELAREKMTVCKGCRFCNGEACRGNSLGPGGKGTGESFIRNITSLRDIRLVMDTIHEDYEVSCECELFGKKMSAPIFAAPIASVKDHFGCEMDEYEYNDVIVSGMRESGMYAFLGDGVKDSYFNAPIKALTKYNGEAIMTIKPWEKRVLDKKLEFALTTNPVAIAMDVDASGLIHLKHTATPISFKSVEELCSIRKSIPSDFIVKGILSVEGAAKALEAGASAIIVSNHGGRVLDYCPSGIEVLEEIVKFVDGRMTVLVDGGFRSGVDVFKALALGADGVLIGRPFSIAAIADGKAGVSSYATKLMNELLDAMRMTGCEKLKDITREKVKVVSEK